MGFAGALAEVGLPDNSIPMAVLAICRASSKLAAGRIDLARLAPIQAYAIGVVASYWMFERVSGFWQ